MPVGIVASTSNKKDKGKSTSIKKRLKICSNSKKIQL